MAKGGNNQRSNGSRFSKPYDTSNSFVKKVALRVSDYLGGWFGTPMKSTGDSARNEGPPVSAGGGDTPITTSSSSHRRLDALDSLRESTTLTRQCFNDVDVAESPAKRLKMESKGKYDIDFPISPIPSTSSGLFQTNINHNFNIQNSEDYLNSGAGPSGLQNQRYAASSTMVQSSTAGTDVKANGAADDHSESSESTSGCSSLVPQSDRLSQSAYACPSRKKNLEEKLSYARQLKQSRASLYLNRSIPVGSDGSGSRRKPSFDISAYGSPMFDKSSVRERMVNSPFYTGQTSYGGASAYKRSRNSSLHAQRNLSSALDRREGLQLQVKPSHHGSTEDLSNMSHTAKRILEALEQFSTPISDAKRIPINAMNPPLGSKRRRFEDLPDSRVKLSTPKSPLNPNAGPSTSGLNVPTVPDLLKLKRLERIQNSTAAARQVAVQNQEYSLPVPPAEVPATKRTGKIVTKLKDKDKEVCQEKLEQVNLPKVPLPITTLPKFDIKLPPAFAPPSPAPAPAPTAKPAPTIEKDKKESSSKDFTFSPPIPVSAPSGLVSPPLKNHFTFSQPLIAETKDVSGKQSGKLLTDFMSNEALSKLKRKSTSDNNVKSLYEVEPAKELKTGSVMDILKKSVESDNNKKSDEKSISDTWECSDCLCRNLKDSKNCVGCLKPKVNPANAVPKSSASFTAVNETKPITVTQGFGDRFKPPSDSWTCKECFVTNSSSSAKCVACETPKPGANPPKEKLAEAKAPSPAAQPIKNSFGDMFKKKAGEWSCSVCMINNKETDTKCAACETPKPGAKVEKTEPPKFNFGIPPGGGGFKFGIDKADVKVDEVKTAKPTPNGPSTENPPAVSTPFGTFTFGIPKPVQEEKKEKDSVITPKVTENTPKTEVSAPLFSSTPITSKPEKPLWNNAAWAKQLGGKEDEKKEENKLPQIFKVDSQKIDPPSNALFKFGNEDKKDSSIKFSANNPPESNPVKFSFGQSSSSGSINSIQVSSSTAGFSFGSVKMTQNSDVTKPSSTLDFLSANKTEVPKFGSEVKEVSSAPSFGSSSFSDSSKIDFGKSTNSVFGSVKSNNPIFGNSAPSTLSAATTASTPFQSSVPAFGTASFNGPTSTPAPSTTFGGLGASAVSAPTTTAAASEPTPTPAFGSGGIPSFGNNQGPFGSNNVATPAFQNPTPAPTSGFGVFGAPSSTFGSSNFNTNPTPAPTVTPAPAATPAFGSAFSSSAAPNKAAPFVFGANTAITTAAPVVPSSSEVFAFGASKPETKPFGSTFGQNGQQPFSFGAPATNNVFGGFAAPKTESAFGTSNPGFGNNAPMNFGMNSAPPAFGSTAPSFEFGSNNPQSQPAPTFQFGAKPQPQPQPASAPATTFSLSVPSSFNFTGGQTPTFSADPTSAPPISQRRMIKAVRRTQR